MSLESGTYVNDLVQANPPGSDDRSQADDHIRLMKSVLKNTFPNASKAFRFPTTALEVAGTVSVAFPADQNVVFSVTAAAAVRTVSLPDPSLGGTVNEDGFSIVVFKTDSSANVVNIVASGSQTINGVGTLPLQKQWDYALLWWSKLNAEWYAITNTSIGTVVFGSVLTPADLSADQNDYAPTGHESAFMFRLKPITAFRTLTGLAGGVPGRIVALSNISTTIDLILNHESVSSAAANRFAIDYIVTSQIVVGPGESVLLYYDGTSARWRPLAGADFYRPIFGTVFANETLDVLIDAVVGNPAAGRLRLYAKTSGSSVVFAYKNSAGAETILDNIVPGALLGILEDNQTSGTAAASLPASTTTTRTLNTEVYDRLGILSLSSNQFTISAAGTYEISWRAPVGAPVSAIGNGFHQTFLYNITDTAEVKRGSSGLFDGGDTTLSMDSLSVGKAVVTIAAAKTFEIRHAVGAYTGTLLQGSAASQGTEVYTQVEIRKA